MKTIATILIGVATAVGAFAQEESLPFSMPIPEGWRTETIPFPLEFAPELPYTGLEELRFAPGMFEEKSEDFWSYAFVWWIGLDEPSDVETMAGFLDDYFSGLAKAVAASRGFEIGEASFGASLSDDREGRFSGWAETFDAFATRAQLRLNVQGEVLRCSSIDHQAIIFTLSPQEPDHEVWSQLDQIRLGFSCLP